MIKHEDITSCNGLVDLLPSAKRDLVGNYPARYLSADFPVFRNRHCHYRSQACFTDKIAKPGMHLFTLLPTFNCLFVFQKIVAKVAVNLSQHVLGLHASVQYRPNSLSPRKPAIFHWPYFS